MHDVINERELRAQVLAQQDLVENLRVALEDVRITLVLWQRLDRREELAVPLEDVDGLGELEVIDVSEHDDVGRRIEFKDVVDECVHSRRLAMARTFSEPHRRLVVAHQRLVVVLRTEVVDDDEQLLAADVEFSDERFPRRDERRIRRIDPAGAERELWPRGR